MGFFSKLLAKEKKSEIEELFSDIREESALFEEFLRLHEEKLGLFKGIIDVWNKGEFELAESTIKKIMELNKRLWQLINKILALEENDKKLFYFIVKEKMNQLDRRYSVYKRQKYMLDKEKYKEYSGALKPYFEQLFAFLKSLSKVILLQIGSIKSWKESASARLVKDMAERKFFYHLLADESSLDRKIKQHLVLIIRTINQFLGYQKRFGVKTKDTGKKGDGRKVITGGLIFYDLRDGKSINFKKFHEIYKNTFPPDEREPKSDLRKFIGYTELKGLVEEDFTRNHLLIAMAGGELVAAVFFATYFVQKRNFCFGVVWWSVLNPKYQGARVVIPLYKRLLDMMFRDAERDYGYSGKRPALKAVFLEVNDPKRMSEDEINVEKKMGINPAERLKYFRQMNLLRMNFHYMQPALPGGEEVDYIMLMVKPLDQKWAEEKRIPIGDMQAIWWNMVNYGFDRTPEKDPTYRKVLQSIMKSQSNGYITFG